MKTNRNTLYTPCLCDGGFTLFETLAATLILGIALVMVLQLFSGALRSGHLAGQYDRAVFHAREKMEEILLLDQLGRQTLSGQWEDGFTWQVTVSPYNPDASEESQNDPETPAVLPGSLSTFSVTVDVQWREGSRQRDVRLQTLHLAEAAYEPS